MPPPLRKFWAAQNIASGEEGDIVGSANVHHRPFNSVNAWVR